MRDEGLTALRALLRLISRPKNSEARVILIASSPHLSYDIAVEFSRSLKISDEESDMRTV